LAKYEEMENTAYFWLQGFKDNLNVSAQQWGICLAEIFKMIALFDLAKWDTILQKPFKLL
jgi:hypothetical protein